MLLSALVVVLFGVFRTGSASFQLALGRQGLQAEARRVLVSMERDLAHAHQAGVSVLDGRSAEVGGEAQPRDAVCVPAVSDWGAQTSYDGETGAPIWDRYAVYYATQEEPWGRLIRLEVDPAPSGAVGPWGGFRSMDLPDGVPSLGAPVIAARTLASHVVAFEVDTTGGTAAVRLLLGAIGTAPAETGERRDERLEIRLEVDPQNGLP